MVASAQEEKIKLQKDSLISLIKLHLTEVKRVKELYI